MKVSNAMVVLVLSGAGGICSCKDGLSIDQVEGVKSSQGVEKSKVCNGRRNGWFLLEV